MGRILKYLFKSIRAAGLITATAAFFACMPCVVSAQQKSEPDSSASDTSNTGRHSPRKATIMSAIVPGLGQIYNHKIWKVPIIYASLGTCVGFAISNAKEAQFYKKLAAENKINPRYDQTSVENGYLYYERNKELCIILTCGIYLLNIIDATVDAYLFDFDVSKELSFHITPAIYQLHSVGILCSFRF